MNTAFWSSCWSDPKNVSCCRDGERSLCHGGMLVMGKNTRQLIWDQPVLSNRDQALSSANAAGTSGDPTSLCWSGNLVSYENRMKEQWKPFVTILGRIAKGYRGISLNHYLDLAAWLIHSLLKSNCQIFCFTSLRTRISSKSWFLPLSTVLFCQGICTQIHIARNTVPSWLGNT